VVEALDNEGERKVGRATSLRRELTELADLFPNVAEIVPQSAALTIGEVLGSESFAGRMPDLSAAILSLEQAARVAYTEGRAALGAAVRRARDELEAMPEWGTLDPEDRDAVSARLSVDDLPQEAARDQLGGDLRRLLTRAARLPSVLSQCKEEVRRLGPAPAPPEPREGASRPAGEAQVVALGKLVPEVVLDSREAVDQWVRELRELLVQLIELGPVHLVDREDS